MNEYTGTNCWIKNTHEYTGTLQRLDLKKHMNIRYKRWIKKTHEYRYSCGAVDLELTVRIYFLIRISYGEKPLVGQQGSYSVMVSLPDPTKINSLASHWSGQHFRPCFPLAGGIGRFYAGILALTNPAPHSRIT
jgi:hypothetical protein